MASTRAIGPHPPFGGVVTELDGHKRALIGRGANTKAPLAIWINALEAIAACAAGLPVNVLFLNEGAEMVGSPNFTRIAEAASTYIDRVDAFLSPRSGEQAGSRDIAVTLGYKNMVTFVLECSGQTWDRGPPERIDLRKCQEHHRQPDPPGRHGDCQPHGRGREHHRGRWPDAR